ncbi:phospholipase D family protein [Ramlibacter sp. MMS24-I3-19]|uniref:phospholipase D family nuclease n=1 Tax=Ramlibacter sp. MMS24-I3-19 TaxID=3416606 RepID=UPI003D089658
MPILRFPLVAPLVLGLALGSGTALAKRKAKGLITQMEEALAEHHSYQVPATGTVEVAFSPDEGSENLVLKVITSARHDIRMLSYSFTSAPVARALLEAKRRGVGIKIVADEKNNTSEDRSGKSRAALSLLTEAGADVRLINVYPIHHDKVLIVDGETVELGSFNYSDAATHRNSENVLVNWKNPQLARVYLEHFARNYRQATPYQQRY